MSVIALKERVAPLVAMVEERMATSGATVF